MTSTLALPAWAADGPEVGKPLPSFTAQDLLGHEHSSQEFTGKRTLLVAITDKNSGDEMRAWFDAADTHAPASAQRESIISLHLPFFVSAATARNHAKPQVPQQYWDDTLLDRNGDMAETLDFSSGKDPYAIALDEHGRVLAVVHGKADSPEAGRIWSSLNNPKEPGNPTQPTRDTSSQAVPHVRSGK
ncbi:hypothetical protein DAT35_41745 [Vitiosangium sp. GDMCC 1.1324]|nr:hypothetical protein DAT35_41745 [Vitiosangium sp. GDMCC 1.1324]